MPRPIEHHLRNEGPAVWELIVRGRPLDDAGLLAAARRSAAAFTWRDKPFIAVSAEVTTTDRSLDEVLAGKRLRTRRTYAAVAVPALLETGFEVLPTFSSPHVSIVLSQYSEVGVRRLIDAFGPQWTNPYFDRRPS